MNETAQALPGGLTRRHIHESNLIEDIDDPAADAASVEAWLQLAPQTELTLQVVLDCHRTITAAQLGEQAGRLRQVNVQVGGYVAPGWQKVPRLVDEWLRVARPPRPPGPRLLHVQFERIHPFVDGNGRVGRMLMWWQQLQRGEPPILLEAARRGEYYAWFHTWDALIALLGEEL